MLNKGLNVHFITNLLCVMGVIKQKLQFLWICNHSGNNLLLRIRPIKDNLIIFGINGHNTQMRGPKFRIYFGSDCNQFTSDAKHLNYVSRFVMEEDLKPSLNPIIQVYSS